MLNAIMISTYAPLGGLRGLSGYTEAPPTGACVPNDFRCGVRGGINSCRPCDLPQLGVFRDLQHAIDRLVSMKSLGAGLSLIDEDGRIGPKTARAAGAVFAAISTQVGAGADVAPALQAASAAPDSPATHRALALAAPELLAYFNKAVQVLGAPQIPRVNLPNDQPVRDAQAPAVQPTATLKKSGMGLKIAGVAAGFLAVGLIGYAASRQG